MADKNTILVNLDGPADLLGETALRCADLISFPSESFPASSDNGGSVPSAGLIEKIEKIADNVQFPLEKKEILAFTASEEDIENFVHTFYTQYLASRRQVDSLGTEAAQTEALLRQLECLSALNICFERLFSCKYIKVRFGRLPCDSIPKLEYYREHPFLVYYFAREGSYLWSIYFTTREFADEADNIFDALFFERVRFPDDIHGTPSEAAEHVRKELLQKRKLYEEARERFSRLCTENRAPFLRLYNEARALKKTQAIRQNASIVSGRFYLTGLVRSAKVLENRLHSLREIHLEYP